jgi:hypothetical protein
MSSGTAYSHSYGAIPQLTTAQIQGLALNTIQRSSKMNLPGITFKITPANGGTIITVTEDPRRENMITLSEYQKEELYIIPDGVDDFDRELGKIITLHRMKQTHE